MNDEKVESCGSTSYYFEEFGWRERGQVGGVQEEKQRSEIREKGEKLKVGKYLGC